MGTTGTAHTLENCLRSFHAAVLSGLPSPSEEAGEQANEGHLLAAMLSISSRDTGGAKPVPCATCHATKDSLEITTPEIMPGLARLAFLRSLSEN